MINIPLQSTNEMNMNSGFSSGFSLPLLSYKTGASETIVDGSKRLTLPTTEFLPAIINETNSINIKYCSANGNQLEITLPITTISLNSIDWEKPVNTFQTQRVTTISEEYTEFCRLNQELVDALKEQDLEIIDFMVIDLDTQQLTFIAPKVQE